MKGTRPEAKGAYQLSVSIFRRLPGFPSLASGLCPLPAAGGAVERDSCRSPPGVEETGGGGGKGGRRCVCPRGMMGSCGIREEVVLEAGRRPGVRCPQNQREGTVSGREQSANCSATKM